MPASEPSAAPGDRSGGAPGGALGDAPGDVLGDAPRARETNAAPEAPAPPKSVLDAMARADAAARGRRLGEAGGICTDVLAEMPDYPPALALLGTLLGHRGETARGIQLLERAIARNREVALWHSNLAALHRFAYRFDEGLNAARTAVRLAPANPGFLVNLGIAHADRGEYDEATNCYLAALGREQENPAAHLALAQALLARGDFAPGWLEYEWRNKIEQAKGMLPKMSAAPWNGMRLPGARLLAVADQGFGDSIQFCRYIPLIAGRAGELVIGCSAELAPLFSRIPGVARAYHRWGDIPAHAAYCLLSSLPLLLRTDAVSIPCEVPYLAPDPARVAAWGPRLDEILPQGRMRVGIAWSGRTTHPNDRRRSLKLEQLQPLGRLPNLVLVPLQTRLAPADAKALAGIPNAVDLTQDLKDFGESAAIMMHLDLVVSIDTAAAHLAGALGRPVSLLLPRPADWRWQHERRDSPWYPSMRLYRQPRPGDWEAVIAEVAEALALQAAGRAGGTIPRA
ncbi:MAG: tetratricopeptide repeat protein [Acetobacteraceae bacterium]